MSEFMSETRR